MCYNKERGIMPNQKEQRYELSWWRQIDWEWTHESKNISSGENNIILKVPEDAYLDAVTLREIEE